MVMFRLRGGVCKMVGMSNKTATVASFGADVSGISSFVTADGMRHIFALKSNGDVSAAWWGIRKMVSMSTRLPRSLDFGADKVASIHL